MQGFSTDKLQIYFPFSRQGYRRFLTQGESRSQEEQHASHTNISTHHYVFLSLE
jgi:hypothetical protein